MVQGDYIMGISSIRKGGGTERDWMVWLEKDKNKQKRRTVSSD